MTPLLSNNLLPHHTHTHSLRGNIPIQKLPKFRLQSVSWHSRYFHKDHFIENASNIHVITAALPKIGTKKKAAPSPQPTYLGCLGRLRSIVCRWSLTSATSAFKQPALLGITTLNIPSTPNPVTQQLAKWAFPTVVAEQGSAFSYLAVFK